MSPHLPAPVLLGPRAPTSPAALQVPSNVPYAHWAWNFTTASLDSSKNCVAAAASDTYDWWLGNSSISAQVKNSSFYQTTATSDSKYGWWVAQGPRCSSVAVRKAPVHFVMMPCSGWG